MNNYNMEKIIETVLTFSSERRYDKLLDVILSKMMEISGSDAGTLYILEDDKLRFRIIKNNSLGINQQEDDDTDILPPIELSRHENISAYSAINNEIVIVDDVYEDERFNFSGPKNYDKMTGYRTRSMLVLPLSTCYDDEIEVLGVIQLLNSVDPQTGVASSYGNIFEPSVLPALANIAANTLSNHLHMKEIQQLFNSFVSVMTQSIDERSAYNSRHTHNVARYSVEFARYLSARFEKGHPFYFSEKAIEELSMAALLHDIGKIITPLSIMDKADRLGERIHSVRYNFEIKKFQMEIDKLRGQISEDEFTVQSSALENAQMFVESVNTASFLTEEQVGRVVELAKTKYIDSKGDELPLLGAEDIEMLSIRKGTLSDSERAIMQDHVSVTARLLDSMTWKYYKNVPEWARNHHEFLDGSGYPRDLKGDALSVGTCILTIADIFEALTAKDRPYKVAFPLEEALSILEQMAREGKLHSELVALFIESRAWDVGTGD